MPQYWKTVHKEKITENLVGPGVGEGPQLWVHVLYFVFVFVCFCPSWTFFSTTLLKVN